MQQSAVTAASTRSTRSTEHTRPTRPGGPAGPTGPDRSVAGARLVVLPLPLPGGSRIRIDRQCRTVAVDGRELVLTYLEFELLAHLVAHPYRVHSRPALTEAIWGYDFVGDGRTVDVHIARLRRKLGARHRESIVTIRRVGYKYVPDDAAAPEAGALAGPEGA